MKKEKCRELAQKLHNWMSRQNYGDESILHPAVCCDFAGASRFVKKIEDIIFEFMQQEETNE